MSTFEKCPAPMESSVASVATAQPEALDVRLYEKFERLNFDDYEYLAGDKEKREEAKKAFLSNEVENPTLDYPKLESFDFEERERQFLELKQEALRHENPVVAQVYRWRINESLAQLRMLKATKEGNDKRFSRYSHFVYGKPSSSVFEEYDKATIFRGVEDALSSGDEQRSFAGNTLQGMVDLASTSENDHRARTPFPEKPHAR